jgi:hypothetical protein
MRQDGESGPLWRLFCWTLGIAFILLVAWAHPHIHYIEPYLP